MALRIVDNQMMLQRPTEMTADRAREMRQTATNFNMGAEVAKDVQQENTRVQHMSETEKAAIRPDENGGNKQESNSKKKSREEEQLPPDEREALNQQASSRLTNLPVERGIYARKEEHSIDIRV